MRSAWSACSANIAVSAAGMQGASPLIAGTGQGRRASPRRLHGGARPCRRLQLRRSPAWRATTPAASWRKGKTVKIFTVGRKGFDILRREFASAIVERVDLPPREADVIRRGGGRRAIVSSQCSRKAQFDVATLYYSRFRVGDQPGADGAADHPGRGAGRARRQSLGGAIYEYEPDEEEILAELLPRNVGIQIFRALLENAASEQGARMSAMDNATRNAGDMIDRLTLSYNRQRQAQITKELIEIISGAEAV